MPRPVDTAWSATVTSVAGQRQCRSVYRRIMSSPTSHSHDPEEASSSSGTVETVNIIQPEDGCDGKDAEKKAKKSVNRCAVCNKKVGLTGFMCRCGGLFCAVHRYSDKHQCTFDYREMGAEEIRRNNPVVVGEKVKKI